MLRHVKRVKSAAKTVVGMRRPPRAGISHVCHVRSAGRLEISVELRVHKELEHGSMHGILQIVGEEVEPGE